MPIPWNHKIFSIKNGEFDTLALEIFEYQYHHNELYRTFVNTLNGSKPRIQSIENIPFLPIRFFKTNVVTTGLTDTSTVFESSGTTGMERSRHFVTDISLYEKSFIEGFRKFYGSLSDYCILGLLPSYLERSNSALVYMVNEWIHQSEHSMSGFYLDELDRLSETILQLESGSHKTLLIGVSFALLDFADSYPTPLKNTIIMETGGMKGRREEMVREELHVRLKHAFSLQHIHSEYGMTELLSQAYSKSGGIFNTPPWMKILIREEDDPLAVKANVLTPLRGVINIIDLANVNSCPFIATDDLGKLHPNGSFEVLGRVDNSDIRGCSLMVATE